MTIIDHTRGTLARTNQIMHRYIDRAATEKLQRDEAEVRRMLGKWVSELEPTILYMRERLVGLGLHGIETTEAQIVVIRAWED